MILIFVLDFIISTDLQMESVNINNISNNGCVLQHSNPMEVLKPSKHNSPLYKIVHISGNIR